jgi:hypothetical protein
VLFNKKIKIKIKLKLNKSFLKRLQALYCEKRTCTYSSVWMKAPMGTLSNSMFSSAFLEGFRFSFLFHGNPCRFSTGGGQRLTSDASGALCGVLPLPPERPALTPI